MLISRDPATGTEVGRVPVTPPAELPRLVARARDAQRGWAMLPVDRRAAVMARVAQSLLQRMDALALRISGEQGKPLLEALVHDVLVAIECSLWCASDVAGILHRERVRSPQLTLRNKRHYLQYEPYGVVGVISPWNFPFSIPFTEVVIALTCGNAVVLKPSELTPLAGNEIASVFEDAGLPDDVLTVVHGGGDVGAALVTSGVDKIFFTGSVSTGKLVMRAAADNLTPVSLELGGKDPMLVLDDADLDLAVKGALWGAFANCGQICASVERAYVDRGLYEPFLAQLVEQAGRLRTGRFDEDGVDLGPMVSERQLGVVKALVDDALANGAKLLTGGPDPRGGLFYRPTVLVDVTPEMRIMREEIFGPVLPVVKVASDDEGVERANESEFGLSASVWSRSRRRAESVARRLDAGSVWVNDHAYSYGAPQLPWGGVKHSGFGRSHSKHGVYECVQVKMLGYDSGRMAYRPYYYPYNSRSAERVPRMVRATYGKGLAGRIASIMRRLPT